MKNTENESNRCNDCEQMFEDNVKGMVNEVDGYTHKDHRHKSEEVHDAYDTDRNRHASNEYGKTTRETEHASEKHGEETVGKVTSKVEAGVKSAAQYAEKTADKAADKIKDGVNHAAASATRFADKTADKLGSKIDDLETAGTHFDKKR